MIWRGWRRCFIILLLFGLSTLAVHNFLTIRAVADEGEPTIAAVNAAISDAKALLEQVKALAPVGVASEGDENDALSEFNEVISGAKVLIGRAEWEKSRGELGGALEHSNEAIEELNRLQSSLGAQ